MTVSSVVLLIVLTPFICNASPSTLTPFTYISEPTSNPSRSAGLRMATPLPPLKKSMEYFVPGNVIVLLELPLESDTVTNTLYVFSVLRLPLPITALLVPLVPLADKVVVTLFVLTVIEETDLSVAQLKLTLA